MVPEIGRWAAVILVAASAACRDAHSDRGQSHGASERRAAVLARTHVWLPPPVPLERVDFGVDGLGPGAPDPSSDVDCNFVVKPIGGTTPKFYCTLPSGERVKVKYSSNEVPAHVAASRLLASLGFFVDRMMRVKSVRARSNVLAA